MIEEKQLYEVGQLFKPHGYKGEINASLDLPEDFYRPDSTALFMEIDGVYVPFFLNSIRSKGKEYLLSFEDLPSLEEIKPYVNKSLYCLKKEVAAFYDLEEDELIDDNPEYVGYDVIDSKTGKTIGQIEEIQESKEYDYIIVRTDEGGEPLMIPFIEEFIVEIIDSDEEEKNGVILVHLPEGMLEL